MDWNESFRSHFECYQCDLTLWSFWTCELYVCNCCLWKVLRCVLVMNLYLIRSVWRMIERANILSLRDSKWVRILGMSKFGIFSRVWSAGFSYSFGIFLVECGLWSVHESFFGSMSRCQCLAVDKYLGSEVLTVVDHAKWESCPRCQEHLGQVNNWGITLKVSFNIKMVTLFLIR